jgi:hypothetical protein
MPAKSHGFRRDRVGSLWRETWFCRKCDQSGDVMELIRHVDGLDFKGAVELLAGDSISRPVRHVAPIDDRRNFKNAIIDPRGTTVETYLNKSRKLELSPDIARLQSWFLSS